jgi:hypothetical protein
MGLYYYFYQSNTNSQKCNTIEGNYDSDKEARLEKQCHGQTENAQNSLSSCKMVSSGKKLSYGRTGAGDTTAVVEGVVVPTVMCSRNLPRDFAR